MTHKTDFGANEQTINQSQLEQNAQKQTDLTLEGTERQLLKIILVGSPEVVRSGILHFYVIGEAEVGDWSQMTPHPSNPDEVMTISSRKIRVNNNTAT